MKKVLGIFAVLLMTASVVGCDQEPAEPEAEPEPAAESEQTDGEGDSAGDEEADGEDNGADEAPEAPEAAELDGDFEYPDFDLGELDDDQRVELAELAHIELCPCEEATNSLHQCMQQQDRCEEADQQASSLLEVVTETEDEETDPFEKRAQQRADNREQHDFELEDTPVKGDPDAEVVIVEFADFQCPHCRTASKGLEEVYNQFGDDVAIFFKNFPVGGQVSQQASRAAMAAHQQDRFWEMHQLLFENQRQIDRNMIIQFARRLGLNVERFQEDMQSDEVSTHVARDREEGIGAGITGTPAIFINGEEYNGALSGQAISAKVAAELDES